MPPLHASDTARHATLAVFLIGAVAILAWSVFEARRRHTWLPLAALAGGVIALPIEPFWDVNVLFHFADNSAPIAFTAFGRPIPVYLAAIYPAFIGFGSYVAYRVIKSGGPLLAIPAVFFAADALIELTGDGIDVWAYYGHQAWDPFGWPIYFGVLNASIPVLGGALLVALEDRIGWLAPLCVPTAYVGIYAIAGWPTWAALNADVPGVVVWVAGAATMAIAAGAVHLCRRPAPDRELAYA